MQAEFSFDITDVELIMNPEKTAFMIRAQTVDQPATGPKRSGKYIHLTLTTQQAMRLLVQLHAAQRLHEFPVPGAVTQIEVPPEKDRH